MRPFFTYYGGKYRAARTYAPPRGVVIEPFAGSAGYSVWWGVEKAVLLDLSEKVCGVWDYLIRASRGEILSLPVAVEHVDDLIVCQEAKWLIGFWLNKGTVSPGKTPSSWSRLGIRPNSVWGENIRGVIAGQVDRIRRWEVRCCSYADYVGDGDTWFVDPPYVKAGVHYHFGSKGIDYGHLGGWCRSRRGLVMVCENEGADWLPFRFHANVKASEAKHGGKVSREVVWMSDPDSMDLFDS